MRRGMTLERVYLRPGSPECSGRIKAIIRGLSPLWIGPDAPNESVLGYGLGRLKDFRHLPYIASL